MKSEEIFSFYDENWNDYNKVMDMLHRVVDSYEEKISTMQTKLSNQEELKELKTLLQDCQDKLDEETHKYI